MHTINIGHPSRGWTHPLIRPYQVCIVRQGGVSFLMHRGWSTSACKYAYELYEHAHTLLAVQAAQHMHTYDLAFYPYKIYKYLESRRPAPHGGSGGGDGGSRS